MEEKIKMIPLENLVNNLKTGLSFSYYAKKNESTEGEEVPFINTKSIKRGTVDFQSLDTIKVEETKIREKERVSTNDLLITIRGSTFKAAVAGSNINGLLFSSNLIALELNKKVAPEVIAAYLNSPWGQMELESRSGGLTIKGINTKKILEISVPVLPNETQQKFASYITFANEQNNILKEMISLREQTIDSILENMLK